MPVTFSAFSQILKTQTPSRPSALQFAGTAQGDQVMFSASSKKPVLSRAKILKTLKKELYGREALPEQLADYLIKAETLRAQGKQAKGLMLVTPSDLPQAGYSQVQTVQAVASALGRKIQNIESSFSMDNLSEEDAQNRLLWFSDFSRLESMWGVESMLDPENKETGRVPLAIVGAMDENELAKLENVEKYFQVIEIPPYTREELMNIGMKVYYPELKKGYPDFVFNSRELQRMIVRLEKEDIPLTEVGLGMAMRALAESEAKNPFNIIS